MLVTAKASEMAFPSPYYDGSFDSLNLATSSLSPTSNAPTMIHHPHTFSHPHHMLQYHHEQPPPVLSSPFHSHHTMMFPPSYSAYIATPSPLLSDDYPNLSSPFEQQQQHYDVSQAHYSDMGPQETYSGNPSIEGVIMTKVEEEEEAYCNFMNMDAAQFHSQIWSDNSTVSSETVATGTSSSPPCMMAQSTSDCTLDGSEVQRTSPSSSSQQLVVETYSTLASQGQHSEIESFGRPSKKSPKRPKKKSQPDEVPPKKRRKRSDPNEPQKPVSAYALFFRDTQSVIKNSNPTASFGEVSKIVASMWEGLEVRKKEEYKRKTDAAKKDYLKQLAGYKASLISRQYSPAIEDCNTNPDAGNNNINNETSNADSIVSRYYHHEDGGGASYYQSDGNLNAGDD